MKEMEKEPIEYNRKRWLLLTLTPYHRLHLRNLYFETGPTMLCYRIATTADTAVLTQVTCRQRIWNLRIQTTLPQVPRLFSHLRIKL